jgi:hypothetical protein
MKTKKGKKNLQKKQPEHSGELNSNARKKWTMEPSAGIGIEESIENSIESG